MPLVVLFWRSPRLRIMAFEISGDELVLVLDPGQRISSFYFGCPRGERFWLRPSPCSRRRRRVTGAQSDGRGPHRAADGRLSRVPAAPLQSITDCFPTGEPWKVLRGLSCPALYCGAVLCLGTQRYFDDATGAPVKDFAASPPPRFFKKCRLFFRRQSDSLPSQAVYGVLRPAVVVEMQGAEFRRRA